VNWQKEGKANAYYRVQSKQIQANSTDSGPSVVATTAARPEAVATEIAALVRQLIDTGKVNDPSQIAFLCPSLKYNGVKNTQVARMQQALEAQGLRVYAPRAGRFLEVEEAVHTFGIFLLIFGKPEKGNFRGRDFDHFHDWLEHCYQKATELCQQDGQLKAYVQERKADIATVLADYQLLTEAIAQLGWDLSEEYQPDRMKRPLAELPGISDRCKKKITNAYFNRSVERRREGGDLGQRPFTLKDVLTRTTSLDWTILDLFYRLSGFAYFKRMFDLAEQGIDEGPICNMALLSKYLSKFVELYSLVLTAGFLSENKFRYLFFMSFLYTVYRRGESEFENEDDPFPKGRIPFLTIHQAKGLEFPVVVLGNLRKDDNGATVLERTIRHLIPKEGEPLNRVAEFDIARMFYVALSRPQNLLILAHFKGPGQRINEPFHTMLDDTFPRIPQFDVQALPPAQPRDDKPPRAYSYTGDYLLYERCPRQYMIFRRYKFVPSRSQTQFFGSLVHRTIEDLHHKLINRLA
jgi:DNA helicase-2/ATP-dependent DNA helicase PcrA